MKKNEARNFKGTRDYLPSEMILRNKLLNKIRNIFELYTFLPMETPAIEYLDILMNKYGRENEKLIYSLNYKGGSVAGLKYDLTIPLSRILTQHYDLNLPFKRYQIQPVWRADRPQAKQGRFREFYQCDADIVGAKSLIADAEILSLTYEILSQLEIGPFIIRINHRKILKGLMQLAQISDLKEKELCQSLDKIDKIGKDNVKIELKNRGFTEKSIKEIFQIIFLKGKSTTLLKEIKILFKNVPIALDGIQELLEIFNYIQEFGLNLDSIHLDLSLARGLEYYTGSIYESSSLKLPHIGSLSGGGRYDNLIKIRNKKLPSVGSTIGLDRIITLIQQLNSIKIKNSLTQILLTFIEKTSIINNLNIIKKLRNAGFKIEIYYEVIKLSKQLDYANKKNIPYVIIIGKKEMKENTVTIKELSKGVQKMISQDQLINFFQKKIKK